MAMRVPIIGMHVHFYISHEADTVKGNAPVEKIGTRVGVVQSGLQNLHPLPGVGDQVLTIEQSKPPRGMHQFFFHR
jgi:hypothetical protein